MIRQVMTLFRGAAHNAAENFTDRNALLILQQQMRDCAHAVTSARTAVAIAIAQNKQEVEQCEQMVARHADLEDRVVSAIEQGKEVLAREAAESVAQLELEIEASKQSQAQFEREISRLRTNVRNAEQRVRDLQRGYRIAVATDKAHKLRETMPQVGLANLTDAEATLNRLRERQQQIDLTAEALVELDSTHTPARMTEKLAEAGCGNPLRTTADDVIARLARAGETEYAEVGLNTYLKSFRAQHGRSSISTTRSEQEYR